LKLNSVMVTVKIILLISIIVTIMYY
jgi:hypothetical protein